MATREELEQELQNLRFDITNEKAEVANRVNALEARVAELEQQVGNGGVVTLEDLQSLRQQVRDIYNPPQP